MIDLEKARREETRWRILKGLDAGRPYGVSESILLNLLADINLPVTQVALRRELVYLRNRELLTIQGEDDGEWLAELTHYGVDVVEYTISCKPGIARPKRSR